MKIQPIILILSVLAWVALIPVFWVFTGWLAFTAYELVTDTEVTSSFWNWRHFGAGLGIHLIGEFIGRAASSLRWAG